MDSRKRDFTVADIETIQQQEVIPKRLKLVVAEQNIYTLLRDCINRPNDQLLIQTNIATIRREYLTLITESNVAGVFNLAIEFLEKCATVESIDLTASLIKYLLRNFKTVQSNLASVASIWIDLLRSSNIHKMSGVFYSLFKTMINSMASAELNRIGSLIYRIAHIGLQSTHAQVRENSLLLMRDVAPLSPYRDPTISFIYMLNDADDRVRRAALRSLRSTHDKIQATSQRSGTKVLYEASKNLLDDSVASVRIEAMQLITALATTSFSQSLQVRNEDGISIRLYEDAFTRICNMMNDEWPVVRQAAATHLRYFTNIEREFLEQTLDKKMLPIMKCKKSDVDRYGRVAEKQINRYGRISHDLPDEWSGGKRLYEEAPTTTYDFLSRIRLPACGAFISALEDEKCEVRCAGIESLGILMGSRDDLSTALYSDAVQNLTDMFNDDVIDLRMHAMHAIKPIMRRTSQAVTQNQLHLVLDVLHDSHVETRMGARLLLQNSQLSSVESLKSTIAALLDNMIKYPNDIQSIFKSLQIIGRQHGEQLMPFMNDLLKRHPYVKGQEPRINDVFYMAKLIVVLNAAFNQNLIRAQLQPYMWRHYYFLKTCTKLVPDNLTIQPLEIVSNYEDGHLSKPRNAHKSISNCICTVLRALATNAAHCQKILANADSDLQTISNNSASEDENGSATASYFSALCQVLRLTISAQSSLNALAKTIRLCEQGLRMIVRTFIIYQPNNNDDSVCWRHSMLLECRARLLLIYQMHSTVVPNAIDALVSLNCHLSPNLQTLIGQYCAQLESSPYTIRATEYLQSLSNIPLVQSIARQALAENQKSRFKSLKDCMLVKELTLLEPFINMNTMMNERSANQPHADNWDTTTTDLHFDLCLKLAVGMPAPLKFALAAKNYETNELQRLKIMTEYSGGAKRDFHRFAASSIKCIDADDVKSQTDQLSDDNAQSTMHHLSIQLGICSFNNSVGEAEVRVSVVSQPPTHYRHAVPCENFVQLAMTNAAAITVNYSTIKK